MISDYGARLMLADAFYLQDTRKVCSGLALLAEAAALAQVAKKFAGILWLGVGTKSLYYNRFWVYPLVFLFWIAWHTVYLSFNLTIALIIFLPYQAVKFILQNGMSDGKLLFFTTLHYFWPDKVGKEEVNDAEENKNGDTLGAKEVDCQGGPAHVQKRVPNDLGQGCGGATDAQEESTLPPETVQLFCSEKHKQFMGTTSLGQILNCNLKNAYAEHERSILSSFRDFLEELIKNIHKHKR